MYRPGSRDQAPALMPGCWYLASQRWGQDRPTSLLHMQMLKGRHVQQRRPCDVLKAQLGSVCQTRFNLLQAGRDIHRSISSAPGSLRAASVAQRRSALCRPFFLLRKVLGFRTFAGCSNPNSKQGWYREGLSSGRGAKDWARRDCGPGRGIRVTRMTNYSYSRLGGTGVRAKSTWNMEARRVEASEALRCG